ncbi:MAG: hypothetical protein KJ623_03935 [Nanoarchaeota archaeon]|nr:hypothetical protein [Nanoarchaeota archaeon]
MRVGLHSEVNDALLNNQDPTSVLDLFTANFTNYARTIDPNLGFIYVYRDKETGQTYVDNYLGLDTPANIYTSNPLSTDPTDVLLSDDTNSINDVSLNINGFTFKKTIPVKVRNFDDSYGIGIYPGQIYLEIAGLFYPINLENDFQVIGTSESGNQVRVDIS